jgi:hypothetical protein
MVFDFGLPVSLFRNPRKSALYSGFVCLPLHSESNLPNQSIAIRTAEQTLILSMRYYKKTGREVRSIGCLLNYFLLVVLLGGLRYILLVVAVYVHTSIYTV